MLSRFLIPCVLFSLLALPVPARAQSGMPSGGDQVVMGRVFHRSEAGTIAVQRFGLVVGSSGPSRVRVEVPSRADDPATGYALEVSAERRRGAVRLSWSVLPAGAVALGATQGSQDVLTGVLGHLPISAASGTQIYASVESGRSSSFDALKLARHFGIPLGGPGSRPPAPRPPAPRAEGQYAPPAPAPAAVLAPRASAAPAESAAILTLGFQLQQEGETAFAPRVRVREGQSFAVRGGQAVEAGGERWDGFELSGVARLEGGRCVVDLAVQSGRRLGGEGAETWLVDRYRRDVAVGLGVESELALFEDLEGDAAGELRLLIRCDRE